MGRWEREITINAPAEKVLEYVADFNRHVEWAGTPFEIRQTSSGPIGVGATFASTGKQFGTHHDQVRVTEFVPGKKIAFESTGDVGLVTHWFTVQDEGERTRLAKGCATTRPSLMTRLSMPLVALATPKGLQKDLERIKARVEGSA